MGCDLSSHILHVGFAMGIFDKKLYKAIAPKSASTRGAFIGLMQWNPKATGVRMLKNKIDNYLKISGYV